MLEIGKSEDGGLVTSAHTHEKVNRMQGEKERKRERKREGKKRV